MSALPVLVLFGLACPDPCGIAAEARLVVEREASALLAGRGFELRAAPVSARRPTGETAAVEPIDEAARLLATRVVVLDLERDGGAIWVTHFLRGVVAPWSATQVRCEGDAASWRCPGLEAALLSGLRPRRAEDVDVVAALRAAAPRVSRCVREHDRLPALERIYGRVELDLSLAVDGRGAVRAIRPLPAARSRLGACLRGALEAIDVGPFEGAPLEVRVPVDL
jgi:hypothetical protein